MDIILSVLKWYGIICLVYGGLWFLYFVVCDLHSLYKNNTTHKLSPFSYYFVHDKWQIFVFSGLAFIPVLNIIHALLMLSMFFKPFNFIIKWLKIH